MKRTLIKEVGLGLGQEVLIKGWIFNIKKMKNFTFITVRDRSGYQQCILDDTVFSLSKEDVVEVIGLVCESKNAYSNYEIKISEVKVINKAESLPINVNTKEEFKLNTILDNRVLSLRNERYQGILKISNIITDTFRSYLNENGFTEIRTPKIVGSGAEGGSNIFKVDYFGTTCALAQSPQFYKQLMVASGYERVYEIGPVFRAEEFSTNRHLNEYTSMDLEMGFIENESDIMDLEEGYIKKLIEVLNENKALYPELLKDIPLYKKIPRISFNEVREILKENKHLIENDIDPQGEKIICKYIKDTYNSDFVFVYDYPRSKRPMYTMPKGENDTRSFDLLFRGIEITTGGQRIHERKMLEDNFKYKGLNVNDFKPYIETFSQGFPPHGGLAIGLERITAMILGFDNIRYTTLFPRDKETNFNTRN